ncbi:c-type cytochrome [Elioraea rosea]|uniref:c-type cytochrome n=1 Tax=Elioraea rosea TaxID=2492390 RepID=UPI00194FC666|nr:c-type cytochrome [Elioraea rosea]
MRTTLMGAAALAAALLFPGAVAAADAARGQALAESCAACHGPGGNSQLDLVPSLAGQQPLFLTLQMILFREGIRAFPPMNEAMKGVVDRDIEDLAAYYASLTLEPQPPARDAAKVERGKALSATHHCGSCHLPDYSGQNQVPRIAGQREDFLLHTMLEYQQQKRSGTDTAMNAALYGLSEADLEALAHYLALQR